MLITHEKKCQLANYADQQLRNGPMWVRILIRADGKIKWLARESADAIVAEHYEHMGSEYLGSQAQAKLIATVTNRVKGRNCDPAALDAYGKEFGDAENVGDFIILPIILAAILSWLIQRLLDWLFLYGDQTSCR